MKNFKRIFCFLLMFVTIGFFSACSKEKSPSNIGDDSEISQGGGQSGGNNGDSGSGDNDEGGSQEVYVPYTSKEIMSVGSKFIEGFFDDFEVDLTDEDLFDDNVNEARILILNTTKMLDYVSQIEDLRYGAFLKGNELVLDDYQGKPNAVSKFYVTFSDEDTNGNSSVKMKIVFS